MGDNEEIESGKQQEGDNRGIERNITSSIFYVPDAH